MDKSVDITPTCVTGVEQRASILWYWSTISGCSTSQIVPRFCIWITKSVPVLEDEFRCIPETEKFDSNFGGEL